MSKLIVIGDRLEIGIDKSREAFLNKDTDYVIDLAKRQKSAGSSYLNVRIGSYPEDAAVMAWVVREVQSKLDNIPLCLNSDNATVIEAGLKVYNRSKKKPIINSADAGKRKDFINLAADNDAKVICVCMKDEVPLTETERINYCSAMLEQGMGLDINPDDMYFDPVTVSIIEEQERLPEVLKTIAQMSRLKLNSICGVSNISIGMPFEVKPIVESAFLNMAMVNGLTAAILNPFQPLLMASIFAGENILNDRLYTPAEFNKICAEI